MTALPTTEQQTPPDWAIERAIGLFNQEDITRYGSGSLWKSIDGSHHAVIAFATYIAAHEQEPVDPLLIEARAACADVLPSMLPSNIAGGTQRLEVIARGQGDNYYETRVALAALRRGMELAKSGEPS